MCRIYALPTITCIVLGENQQRKTQHARLINQGLCRSSGYLHALILTCIRNTREVARQDRGPTKEASASAASVCCSKARRWGKDSDALGPLSSWDTFSVPRPFFPHSGLVCRIFKQAHTPSLRCQFFPRQLLEEKRRRRKKK